MSSGILQARSRSAISPLRSTRRTRSHSTAFEENTPADLDMPSKKSKAEVDLSLAQCVILKRDAETIDDALIKHASPRPLDIVALAAAITQGCSAEVVDHYLDSYTAEVKKSRLQEKVSGHDQILFYAAERNDAEVVRVLLNHGADPNCRGFRDVPLLAYTIMRSKWTVLNPLDVVKTLLAHGAQSDVIPMDLWRDFMNMPSATPPLAVEQSQQSKQRIAWCTSQYRAILAQTMHLSIRYFLYKATQVRPCRARGMQLANAHDYAELLKVPYMVIGQQFACRLVVEQVSAHIGMNVAAPLVLTFAGLSGHGKTELATKMGELLNVNLTNVDCAQMSSDVDIFGPHVGWAGYMDGSQLNNHLADHNGERSVIFLDEFDKTDKRVHNSLLLILDSGHYYDRRNNNYIDCSKTIWIMATNLGDHEISRFYEDNMLGLSDHQKLGITIKVLTKALKDRFTAKFGAPMAGRMRNVAPFYPFDIAEQAVVLHKFLLELTDECRKDIDTSPASNHLCRHMHVNIHNDGPLCKYMAEDAYLPDLGARSLKSCADEVRKSLFITYVDSDDVVVNEMNDRSLRKYNVHLLPTSSSGGSYEVVVTEDGSTEFFTPGKHRADGPEPMLIDQDINTMTDMMSKYTIPRPCHPKDESDDET